MCKEMVYGYESKNEVLISGKGCGFEFKIMNYGTHPCSYIRFTVKEAHALGWEDEEIDEWDSGYCYKLNCHGGCTYTDAQDPETKKKEDGYIWAGWDYAHAGDFMGYSLKPGWPVDRDSDHRYTLKELVDDMIYTLQDAAKQLEEEGDRNGYNTDEKTTPVSMEE